MIVFKHQYYRWIGSRGVGSRDRVAWSPDSYVSYLNRVSDLVGKDVSPDLISSEDDIQNIVREISSRVSAKTLQNYKSAMRQYVAMVREMPALHIVQGSPDSYSRILKRAASGTRRVAAWTVPKSAKPGDRVFFYIVRPVSLFVGTGVVAEHPSRNARPDDPWFGHFMAPMHQVLLLPQPVPLDQVRQALPDWGYLRNVRVGATVPVSLRASFEEVLRYAEHPAASHSAELSDLEGTLTETKHMVRGRSRRLRSAALERSRGICAVCERDFSKVLCRSRCPSAPGTSPKTIISNRPPYNHIPERPRGSLCELPSVSALRSKASAFRGWS